MTPPDMPVYMTEYIANNNNGTPIELLIDQK
jgi:hypothetical protein